MPRGRNADLSVSVDGQPLPSAAYIDLLDVQVQADVSSPSMAALRLFTWDDKGLQLSWVDDELFAPGKALSIELGYAGGAPSLVFVGDITGVELELNAGEPPMLSVRGYDRRHRLLRGTKTRSFPKLKDSDIAAKIAQENGLTAQVTETSVEIPHVVQHGQSDLDFLKARASLIGYEVVVEDKILHFRPHALDKRVVASLAVDSDLISFNVRLSTRDMAGEIRVLGSDSSQKKAIIGKAKTGQERAMGGTPGPKAADKAFGAAVSTIVDRPLFNQQEGDKIALGQLENMALRYITGDATCFGRAEITPGATVEITGAGKRFSGNYYVEQVTHSYSPKNGYRTSFSVRRNAT